MGYEHGKELGRFIPKVISRFSFALSNDYGKDWQWFKEFCNSNFAKYLDHDFIDEIESIKKGANEYWNSKLDFNDILTLNCIPEIDSYFSSVGVVKREPSCSSFIANGPLTNDGKYILAHTTWWRYYTARSFQHFFVIKPSKGNSFAMQSAPGFLFSFTDFYYNNKGIAISETTMDGIKTFNMNGTPLFQRLRKAIQYSSTIDEVASYLLKNNNGSYANDYLIGSKDGIAILEMGTFNYTLMKKNNGFFVSSNRVQFDNLYSESSIDYSSLDDSDSTRFLRLTELVSKGNLEVEKSKEILSDHYDYSTKSINPGKNTICGHREVEPNLDPFDKRPPFFTTGSIDGKIVTLDGAINGYSNIKWGKPCGTPFYSEKFLAEHPEYSWLKGHLEDIIPGDWQLIEHGW